MTTIINRHNHVINSCKKIKRKANGDRVEIADNDGSLSFSLDWNELSQNENL